MSGEKPAALITKVFGSGTSEDDEVAYVECEINNSERCSLAFAARDASQVAVAFVMAAGNVEKKQAMKRLNQSEPFFGTCTPATGVEIAVDISGQGAEELIFRMVIAGGATLAFAVPRAQIPGIIGALNSAMGMASTHQASKPN